MNTVHKITTQEKRVRPIHVPSYEWTTQWRSLRD